MSHDNRPITSREYKLVLNANRFQDRQQGATLFRDLVIKLVKDAGGKILKEQDAEEERRTRFLDVPGHLLRASGMVFRLRTAVEEKETKATLKYRSADRYLAASEEMTCTDNEAEFKFEEDLTPPLVSKFSHSVSLKEVNPDKLKRMENLVALFPDLKRLNIDDHAPLEMVGDFEAVEIFHKTMQFSFDKDVTVRACFNFWYLLGNKDEYPLVAEFSYDFDAGKSEKGKLETFSIPTCKGCKSLFMGILRETDWLATTSTTKTAYVYSRG